MDLSALRGGVSAYFRADRDDLGNRFLPALICFGAVLAAAALGGIVWMAGAGRVWHAVLHGDWALFFTVPVAVFVSHLGYTVAYRQVARSGPGGQIGARDIFALVTVGFGPVSPRGGFALDAAELMKRGLSEPEARCRVKVLSLLEYAVLAPATLAAAAYLLAEGARTQAGLLPSWVIAVPVGAVMALILLRRYRSAGRPRRWYRPLRRWLDAFNELLALLGSWPAGPLAVGGMTLYWAGELAALIACVDAFVHHRGTVAVMIVGYATGYALTRRALPLGGAGVVEALLPFSLNWVGLPLAASVAAVLAYRLIALWLALVPAYFGLRYLRQGDESRRAGRRAPAPSTAPVTGRVAAATVQALDRR